MSEVVISHCVASALFRTEGTAKAKRFAKTTAPIIVLAEATRDVVVVDEGGLSDEPTALPPIVWAVVYTVVTTGRDTSPDILFPPSLFPYMVLTIVLKPTVWPS